MEQRHRRELGNAVQISTRGRILVFPLERKVILITLTETQEPDGYLRSSKTIGREADPFSGR